MRVLRACALTITLCAATHASAQVRADALDARFAALGAETDALTLAEGAVGLLNDALGRLAADGTDLFILLGMPTDAQRLAAASVAGQADAMARRAREAINADVARIESAPGDSIGVDDAQRLRRITLARDRALPLLESRVALLVARAGAVDHVGASAERVSAMLGGVRYDDVAIETRRLLALGHAALLKIHPDDARTRFAEAGEIAPDNASRLEAALGRVAAALRIEGPAPARAALAELERSDLVRNGDGPSLARLLCADARFLIALDEAQRAQAPAVRTLTMRDAWESYLASVAPSPTDANARAIALDRLGAASAHIGDEGLQYHGLARLGAAVRLARDPARADDAIDALSAALTQPDEAARLGVVAPDAWRLLATLQLDRDAERWSHDALGAANALLSAALTTPVNEGDLALLDAAAETARRVAEAPTTGDTLRSDALRVHESALRVTVERHGATARADEPRLILAQLLAARGDLADAIALLDGMSGAGPYTVGASCLAVDACARLWRDAPDAQRPALAAAYEPVLLRRIEALAGGAADRSGDDAAACLIGAHALRADLLSTLGRHDEAVASCRAALDAPIPALDDGRAAALRRSVSEAVRIGAAVAWSVHDLDAASWFTVRAGALLIDRGWSGPARHAAHAAIAALDHAHREGNDRVVGAVASAVLDAFERGAGALASADAFDADAVRLALAEAYLVDGRPAHAVETIDAMRDEHARTPRAAVVRAEGMRGVGDVNASFERLRAVAVALEQAGRLDDDFWRAWAGMLEILQANNADGGRTPVIAREVARLRILDAALGGPPHAQRIGAVERAIGQ